MKNRSYLVFLGALGWFFLGGFSTISYGATVSCNCNDTKGCGDFARECCAGFGRIVQPRRAEPSEEEPLVSASPSSSSLHSENGQPKSLPLGDSRVSARVKVKDDITATGKSEVVGGTVEHYSGPGRVTASAHVDGGIRATGGSRVVLGSVTRK
jgi:hypothetical protein